MGALQIPSRPDRTLQPQQMPADATETDLDFERALADFDLDSFVIDLEPAEDSSA